MKSKRKVRPTSYRLYLLRLLSPCNEDDVPLRRFDIAILENEQSLNAVFLKRAELDEQSNRTKQILLNDEILFPSNLA